MPRKRRETPDPDRLLSDYDFDDLVIRWAHAETAVRQARTNRTVTVDSELYGIDPFEGMLLAVIEQESLGPQDKYGYVLDEAGVRIVDVGGHSMSPTHLGEVQKHRARFVLLSEAIIIDERRESVHTYDPSEAATRRPTAGLSYFGRLLSAKRCSAGRDFQQWVKLHLGPEWVDESKVIRPGRPALKPKTIEFF